MSKIDLFSAVSNNSVTSSMKFAIFDLESTGLDIIKDDPIEVAVSVVKNGKVIDRYHSMISTDIMIPESVKAIHNISNAMLKNSPQCHEVINHMYSKFGDCIWVAHNCWNFDAPMLIARSPNLLVDINYLDTKVMAKSIFPGLAKAETPGYRGSYSMDFLANLFGLTNEQAHRAETDVDVLVSIFDKMVRLVNSNDELQKFIKKGYSLAKKHNIQI